MGVPGWTATDSPARLEEQTDNPVAFYMNNPLLTTRFSVLYRIIIW